MSIATLTAVKTYSGNGSALTFPIDFVFLEDSEINVLVTNSSGTDVTSSYTYTVSGGADSDGLAGTGNVVFTSAPASGTTIKITRATVATQAVIIARSGPFPAKTVEHAIDKVTLLTQDLDRRVDEAEADIDTLEAGADALTDAIAAAAASAAAAAASAAAADASADQIAASYVTPSPTTVYEPFLLDDISGSFDGATQEFNLTTGATAFTPGNAADIEVFFNGVRQKPGTAYTVALSAITFTFTPAVGDECYIIARRNAVYTTSTSLGTFVANTFAPSETVSDARDALGLGTMAVQNANAVAITGGAVSGFVSVLDDISGSFDGLTAAFALTVSAAAYTPNSQNNLLVVLDGVVQEPGSSYTVAGSTITFTFNPASGQACHIRAFNV